MAHRVNADSSVDLFFRGGCIVSTLKTKLQDNGVCMMAASIDTDSTAALGLSKGPSLWHAL